MAICSRCGNSIEFRYKDGRRIPMHQEGGCVNTGGSTSEDCEDYSGYRTSKEGQCFSTKCPECSDEVFFIRHNGGSVWIDPPLGYPWCKHSCFEGSKDSKLKIEARNIFTGTSAAIEQIDENSILGIVKSTEVSYTNMSTVLIFETGKKEKHILLMRNNAGYLVGKLALYSPCKRTVTVFDEPRHPFAVVTEIHSQDKECVKNGKVICPELDCGVELKNDIPSHFMNEHLYTHIFGLRPTSG